MRQFNSRIGFMRLFSLIVLASLATSFSSADAQARQRINSDGSLRTIETKQSDQVREILKRYYEGKFEGDIALLKLAIDKTIDPNIDINQTLNLIDQAVFNIQMMAGPNANEARLLDALRAFIYQPGDWNDHNPYSYNHDDPLGENIKNKLLATYLQTKRGNCASMPTLVLILGQRLGLNMTLATAQSHVLVKYKPRGTQDWINLETTSGANPARLEWTRENFPMTDRALKSGLYMRALSDKELAAQIAVTALEDAYGEKRYWDAILIAERIMEVDRNNLSAILLRASSLSHLMEEDFHRQFPEGTNLSQNLIAIYQSYGREMNRGFDYAFELGFVPEEAK